MLRNDLASLLDSSVATCYNNTQETDMNMNNTSKWTLVGALLLAILTITSLAQAAPKSVDQLIQELGSPDAGKVTDAMARLEDMYRKGVNVTIAVPVIKKLLADTREPVRRKTARILGVFHVQLTDAELHLVCAQLKATDWREVQSALKALRDLNVPSTITDILPCLQHPVPGVVRDACRTLAVLGKKDVIPSIEPLLNSPDKAVRKDAQDAIAVLRAKP